jgi:hypothetical protein
MAARERRTGATLAVAILVILALVVILGVALGGRFGGGTLARIGGLPRNAPALGPGPANPAPLPSPIPRRPG